ncbi:MAG: GNAT family N-acetyltransferase [Bullifex sp.]
MDITLKKADDREEFVSLRVRVLRAANMLPESTGMEEVERESRIFFDSGDHLTLYAYADGVFAGCGSVCFYTLMPTYHNPSGKKAYIMNMYTEPEYRRMGIASAILKALVEEAGKRGVKSIALEATDMGRPCYEKFGFVSSDSEMEYVWK